jgi:hypothetical protein
MKILSTIILVTASFAISFGQNVYMTSKSNIHFTSDAPLEVIEATSTQLQGALKTDDRSFVFNEYIRRI